MKALLGKEYDDYIASFDAGRFYGLRANTLKISGEELQVVITCIPDELLGAEITRRLQKARTFKDGIANLLENEK